MGLPTERPVVYCCQGEPVVGILHVADGSTGVLMVVGGPQVRAGSHRLYVQQARHIARQGTPVFRFDTRGMGDSGGHLPGFEQLLPDIQSALAAFRTECPTVQRLVLWGLCDGASAALLYLHAQADPSIVGLCLINPWVRTPATQARTQVRHYYLQRLRHAGFWRKLLTGQVARSALSQVWAALRASRQPTGRGASAPAFPARMARTWQGFDGPMLLVLSEQDYTAREFLEAVRSEPAWRGALGRPGLTRIDVSGADHTFSNREAALALGDGFADWLRRHLPEPATSPKEA